MAEAAPQCPHRLVPRDAVTAALVVGLAVAVTGLALKSVAKRQAEVAEQQAVDERNNAVSQRERAETAGRKARLNLYAADMFLAARALEQGNLGLASTAWPMFRHDARHTARAAVLPNTPPTISALGHQTIDEDTTLGPLAFTIADAETAASNLTVSALL